MSGGRPFFAFAFHNGLGQSIGDYADADIAAGTADFVWLHLDLGDQASQVWLSGRPWPADVVQLVAAPIQRGRLFVTSELIYGHLRDFREVPLLTRYKRAHYALSPPGQCLSPVDASRCAQSKNRAAASKGERSVRKARSH